MPGYSGVELIDDTGTIYGAQSEHLFRSLIYDIMSACDDASARLALLHQFVSLLLTQQIIPRRGHALPMQLMLQCLWSGLTRGVTAADLVTASGLGRSQVYHIFTKSYGCSPYKATPAARTDLAIALRAARSSASAAARYAGFTDYRAWARRIRLRQRNQDL